MKKLSEQWTEIKEGDGSAKNVQNHLQNEPLMYFTDGHRDKRDVLIELYVICAAQ
jgi:hypothetical protein